MGKEQILHKESTVVARAAYAELKGFSASVNNKNEVMVRTIEQRLAANTPIRFAGFYGMGAKHAVDQNDITFMDEQLLPLLNIAHSHDLDSTMTAILADEHARFNGYLDETPIFPNGTESYAQQVKEMLAARGIDSVLLSSLYAQYGVSLPDIESPVDPESDAYRILQDRRLQHRYLHSARHNRRNQDPERTAYHYLIMRLNERDMLRAEFGDGIFFVNGGKDLAHPIMPIELPILYLNAGPVWFQNGHEKGGEL